jgi:hypothetical protein
MTNNQKIALGVAGAIALYFLLRPKAQAQPQKNKVDIGNTIPQEALDINMKNQIDCSNLLTERLKTVRVADLDKYKADFMFNCLSKQGEFANKGAINLENLFKTKSPFDCNCIKAPCNC